MEKEIKKRWSRSYDRTMHCSMTIKRKVTVAVTGSFVEWYDFALIGALSTYINNNFFDEYGSTNGLINIFLIFAVGFLARPLGAFFFGYYGDQYGRQPALRLSLVLVSSTTLLIGCLPNAQQIGILATISLAALRFVQGFGSGGEHAGGILLLYEDEPSHKHSRANYAILAIMAGLFFGFISAYLLRLFFTEEIINAWAWRIPFIFGGLLGLWGVVLRMRVSIGQEQVEEESTGLKHYKNFFIENKRQILIASGIYIHSVAIFYINYFFYPGYVEKHELISSAIVNEMRVVMAVVFIFLFLFLGRSLNSENANRWLKLASIAVIFLIFPLHYAMTNFGIYGYGVAMGVLTVLNVIYLLPIAGVLAGMFPKKYRYTGVSLAINIVSSLFGGTAPLLLALLVSYFNSFAASGAYLFATAMIGYLTACSLKTESEERTVYAEQKIT
jgi:MFS transporter, MHS family, proline/betaine transporter